MSAKSTPSSRTSLNTLERGRIAEERHRSSSHDAAGEDVGFYFSNRSQSLVSDPAVSHAVSYAGLDWVDAIDENGLDVNEFDELVLPGEINVASLIDVEIQGESGPIASIEDDSFVMPVVEVVGSVQEQQVCLHTKKSDTKLTLDITTD